jgi:hypothetical protein
MIELGPATKDDAVLAYLQAEIDDPDRGPLILAAISALNYDRSLIDNGDVSDAHANFARAVSLGLYRGYGLGEYVGNAGNTAFFVDFPSDTTWRRVQLDLNDIGQLRYVGIQAFTDLSKGTHLVAQGASNYKANSDTANKVDIIREKISRGISRGVLFPELVLVEDGQSRFVIIEGNHRATAYAVERVNGVHALVGTSLTMDRWPFIGPR